jgi:MFS family permease
MNQRRSFLLLTLADFIVRSAYQMGKTPLLPIFAAALGASGSFLGFIVSVSTLTGMVLKPFIGIMSDRWGRRAWLLVGTAFFAGMPFVYQFVQTSEHLFAVRIVHGLATAIYGPVTLAYVAQQSQSNRAERLGWFGMAREAGYVLGPTVAGVLLLFIDPVAVFTIIGLLSCLAFIPVFLLHEAALPPRKQRPPLFQQTVQALRMSGRTPAIWISGGLDATMYIALYAIKAFLPVQAMAAGVNTALVGVFFTVQEATNMLLNPAGGRLGDRWGYRWVVGLGMFVLGATLPLLTLTNNGFVWLAPAVLMGVAQSLAFPSIVALVSTQVDEQHLGAGMGLIGTLDNAGKVIGPILAGWLIVRMGFANTIWLMGGGLLIGAMLVWRRAAVFQKRAAAEASITSGSSYSAD